MVHGGQCIPSSSLAIGISWDWGRGAEPAVHAIRHYLSYLQPNDAAVLKFDFSQSGDRMLEVVHVLVPDINQFVQSACSLLYLSSRTELTTPCNLQVCMAMRSNRYCAQLTSELCVMSR